MKSPHKDVSDSYSWESFIDESFDRLNKLITSRTRLIEYKHFRRALRFVITGSADATKGAAWLRIVGAIVSSPELIAVLVVLATALGSVVLSIISLPVEFGRLISPMVANSKALKYLHGILSREEIGIRIILAVVVVAILVLLVSSAYKRSNVRKVLTAKGFICTSKQTSRQSWLSDPWFEIAASSIPHTSKHASPVLHTFTWIIAFLSSLLASFSTTNSGIENSLILIVGLCAGWIHLWMDIRYTDDKSLRSRIHDTIAGISGCIVLPMFVTAIIVVFFSIPVINESLSVKIIDFFSTTVIDIAFIIGHLYSLFYAFWLLFHLPTLHEALSMLRTHHRVNGIWIHAGVNKSYHPLTFIGWGKRTIWGYAFSTLFFAAYTDVIIFLAALFISSLGW